MSWKSWAARIGGYAAAPWTGGASIAVGEGIAQGLEGNEAIDDANQAQQQATNQAVAEQQKASGISADVYQQQRADLAPYRDLGGQAFSTLGGLMGFSQAAAAAPTTSVNRAVPEVLATPAPTGRQMRPESEPTGTYAGSRGGTLASIQQAAQTQRQSGYGGPQARVKAPNGQVYLVPRERVQEALANGGQEVA